MDQALAARGAAVYAQHCAACHADHRFRDGSARATASGQVEPIDRIGTDRHRLDSYTRGLCGEPVRAVSRIRRTGSREFRKTNGYANHPLDGIWLRGPYLHNGSVPTLRDLLDAPARRPTVVLSRLRRVRSGKAWASCRTVAQADGRSFFRLRHDACPATATAGTSTARRCPTPTRRAIVEYLKTF